ncbi:peptidoglycan-binding protein [Streptomyces sp. E11-3]|uniref:peptidoglycan-binding protein n=1 Tax=Streptomyces sp. E11-3 TaxID=3110112 RepID=UPI003981238B
MTNDATKGMKDMDTVHRCCPGCGVELAALPGGVCGCAGPFTAEQVDPMHIRPYAAEPPPPVLSAPLPPYVDHELMADEPPQPYREPTPGGTRARGSRRRKPRRRKGVWVLAGGGVAAATALLFTQVLADGDDGARGSGAADRVRVDDGDPSPSDTAPSASDRPSTSGSPSADASSAEPSRTAGSDPSAPAASERQPDGARTSGAAGGGASRDRERAKAPSDPTASQGGDKGPARRGNGGGSGTVLRPGDSGAGVTELQRRLKQTGYLAKSAPEDGQFTTTVQEAVFRYQAGRGIRGDRDGEYGKNTRRALEAETAA